MGEKLYHYTSLEKALNFILPTKKLRLSSIVRTNDPRETQDWYPSIRLTQDMNDERVNELMDELKITFNTEKKKAKLICFSQDHNDKEWGDDTNAFSLELRKGYFRFRMWANYADNHSGICLEFDKDILISSIKNELEGMGKLYSGSVTYTNYSAVQHYRATSFDSNEINTYGLTSVINKHLEESFKHIFFEKLYDWRDEAEFRILHIPKDHDEEVYVNIGNSLTNIYVGANYDNSKDMELETVKENGQYPLLDELKQIRFRNSTPFITPLVLRSNVIE
ncbi:DUF2971 domain-containing protein [Metabacillus niabensis]|uniref:DUF2971 domain-containing protein n=1 Tax=Metabacillus niabensis TaxID=324854 RepID=UPI00399F0F2B